MKNLKAFRSYFFPRLFLTKFNSLACAYCFLIYLSFLNATLHIYVDVLLVEVEVVYVVLPVIERHAGYLIGLEDHGLILLELDNHTHVIVVTRRQEPLDLASRMIGEEQQHVPRLALLQELPLSE